MRARVLHPVREWRFRAKKRDRPCPGEAVIDCRGEMHQVTAVDGDDLILDDGANVSWMHCCSRPEKS